MTERNVADKYTYQKKDLLGHGAFAAVFKGKSKEDEKGNVAIKVINRSRIGKQDKLLGKEVQILKKLKESDEYRYTLPCILECERLGFCNHMICVLGFSLRFRHRACWTGAIHPAKKHDNIVCLLDYEETKDSIYLVMEYCNSGDLADYLHKQGTLSEDTERVIQLY
jgi:serine/threonine protein kinase